ncbi:hypothetical protein FGB62_14g287 [Gracilaria domingensis]|nr:hypothetical protein FGB62_14g287 [Gracilaria domingensis]
MRVNGRATVDDDGGTGGRVRDVVARRMGGSGRVTMGVDVRVIVLVQAVLAVDVVEDDDSDLGVAEHGELHGLLEQPIAALGEGDLAVAKVGDALDADLLAAHVGAGARGGNNVGATGAAA